MAAMDKDRQELGWRQALGSRRALRIATWATLGITALLVAVFVLEVVTFEALDPPRPSSGEEAPRGNQIVAGRSTISGFDKDSQPFVYNAAVAKQDAEKDHIVHLTTVDGELRKRNGTIMTVSATGAVYDTDSKVLDLEGNVIMVSKGKFVADMDKARVFLDEKRLVTDVQVTVVLDYGKIVANAAEVTDNGNRVLFFNRVKATYSPADSKGNRQ
jgi:lipopolysaccharide export system protein LptC